MNQTEKKNYIFITKPVKEILSKKKTVKEINNLAKVRFPFFPFPPLLSLLEK